jgi:hypothetical protein
MVLDIGIRINPQKIIASPRLLHLVGQDFIIESHFIKSLPVIASH